MSLSSGNFSGKVQFSAELALRYLGNSRARLHMTAPGSILVASSTQLSTYTRRIVTMMTLVFEPTDVRFVDN